MFLVQKYTEYRAAQAQHSKKKVTEKELFHLNTKIEKLLLKLDEHELELATNEDEECVVCITAKANMTTYPCAHSVLCRKCFVKTIQMAVTERRLPLRCVICRTKILRLKQGGGQVSTSESLYSVSSKSSTSSVPSTSGSSGTGFSRKVGSGSISTSKSVSSIKKTKGVADCCVDVKPSKSVSSTTLKPEAFSSSTFRRVQMARLGYEPLRSLSPPPPAPPKPKPHVVPPKVSEPPPEPKGKAKLSLDFQRQFRQGLSRTTISNNNSIGGVGARVRSSRGLSVEQAWKAPNGSKAPSFAQGPDSSCRGGSKRSS